VKLVTDFLSFPHNSWIVAPGELSVLAGEVVVAAKMGDKKVISWRAEPGACRF